MNDPIPIQTVWSNRGLFRTCRRRWLIIVWFMLFIGCDSGPKRIAIEGTVTLDGQPLQQATLILTPKTNGSPTAAVIENGRFGISAEYGPTPGDYFVRINPPPGGQEPTVREPGLERSDSHRETDVQRIPIAYQRNGEISVTLTGDHHQLLRFALRSR